MAEVVVTYRDPAAARRAITTLERHGVDAGNIHLLDAPGARMPTTDAAQNEPDMAVTGTVARRGFATAIATAVGASAVASVVAWFVSGGSGTAVLIAAVGFFMAGGSLGFFYGGASGLAVSDEWGETFEATGPATLAFTVDDDGVIDLRERLEATHPDRIMVT